MADESRLERDVRDGSRVGETSRETTTAQDLCDQIAQHRTELLRRVSSRNRLRTDPELRKVLCRITACLNEFERMVVRTTLDGRTAPSDGAGARSARNGRPQDLPTLMRQHSTAVASAFGRVFEKPVVELSLDAAAEVIDALDQFLIEVGDRHFLVSCYYGELYRDRERHSMEAPFVTWSDLFGPPPSPDAMPPPTPELRTKLSALRRARANQYRLHRARLAMRRRTLFQIWPVLAVLSAAFAISVYMSNAHPSSVLSQVALTASAGAVGAVLSGTYKLRDEVARLADLRALAPALYVQPLIGATAGVIILLVLISGFLPQGADETWAKYGIVAFLAGFSEPFFLGVVARVAGTKGDTRPPNASPEAGA